MFPQGLWKAISRGDAEKAETTQPALRLRVKNHHRNCFISPSTTRANCGSFCIFSSIFSTEYITVE